MHRCVTSVYILYHLSVWHVALAIVYANECRRRRRRRLRYCVE